MNIHTSRDDHKGSVKQAETLRSSLQEAAGGMIAKDREGRVVFCGSRAQYREAERRRLTWTCPYCGQDVPPFEIPPSRLLPGGMRRRRAYCSCPGGQRQEKRDERERRRKKRQSWLSASHLEPGLAFKSFKGDSKALSYAVGYATALLNGETGWLWIYGPRGTGKRHLANAVGLAVIQHSDKDPRVRYLDWPTLFSGLSYYSGDSNKKSAVSALLAARKSGLVILDRVSDLPRNCWAVGKTVNFLAYRAHREKPTIATSSLPLDAPGISLRQSLMSRGGFRMRQLLDEWSATMRRQVGEKGIAIRTRVKQG